MASRDRPKIRKSVRTAADRAVDQPDTADVVDDAVDDDLAVDDVDVDLTEVDDVADESAAVDDDVDADDDGDADVEGEVDADVDVEGDARLEAYQDELIDRRAATIAAARRRHGTAAAAIAAVGLQLQKMIEGKEDNEPAVIVQANSDPEDFESDGITVEVDGGSYHSPPLERIENKS